MADESIDETLSTCTRLMQGVMFDDFGIERPADDTRDEIRIVVDRKNAVVVGIGPLVLADDVEGRSGWYSHGRGSTFLEAIADWRARLTKGAQKKMAEHDAFRKFVEERGLLR